MFTALRLADSKRAYRELIQLSDDLAAEHGAIRVALAVTPPAPVGDERFDAFLAALAEHYLDAEGLPVPGWTSEPARLLQRRWIVDEFANDDIAAVTPEAFVRHNILIDSAELVSA